MIKIDKHENGYTAIVTSTNGEVVWSWLEPIPKSAIWAALFTLECHQIDVIEAFAASDPEESKKLWEAADSVMRTYREPGGPARIQRRATEFSQQLQEKYGSENERLEAIRTEHEHSLREHFDPDEIAKIVKIGSERRY